MYIPDWVMVIYYAVGAGGLYTASVYIWLYLTQNGHGREYKTLSIALVFMGIHSTILAIFNFAQLAEAALIGVFLRQFLPLPIVFEIIRWAYIWSVNFAFFVAVFHVARVWRVKNE